jgi:hypothetical protein
MPKATAKAIYVERPSFLVFVSRLCPLLPVIRWWSYWYEFPGYDSGSAVRLLFQMISYPSHVTCAPSVPTLYPLWRAGMQYVIEYRIAPDRLGRRPADSSISRSQLLWLCKILSSYHPRAGYVSASGFLLYHPGPSNSDLFAVSAIEVVQKANTNHVTDPRDLRLRIPYAISLQLQDSCRSLSYIDLSSVRLRAIRRSWVL